MIALIQRVESAQVHILDKLYSEIKYGYLIFLGVAKSDSETDIEKLVDKIANLRIMPDNQGKMNKSIIENKGEILVVSQFTLNGNLKGGRRPDFFPAMEPIKAEKLYDIFIEKLKDRKIIVKSGQFAAYMKVSLLNDGPVTFILNSNNL